MAGQPASDTLPRDVHGLRDVRGRGAGGYAMSLTLRIVEVVLASLAVFVLLVMLFA